MNAKRIAAAVLSVALVALLGRSIFAGAGDFRTRILLGIGVILGLSYVAIGRVPDWIVRNSAGSITHDDDPSNISPTVYLSILFGVISIAITVFFVVVFVL